MKARIRALCAEMYINESQTAFKELSSLGYDGDSIQCREFALEALVK